MRRDRCACAIAVLQTFGTPLAAHAADPHDDNVRIMNALHAEQRASVSNNDPLGEGDGAFDPDPLGPSTNVDCMTWLQQVLARATSEKSDVASQLRRIRYFGPFPEFATRKHYVDHWLDIDPYPLRRVEIKAPTTVTVTVDSSTLARARGFSGPMPAPRTINVPYVTTSKVLSELDHLRGKFYVLSAIASPTWKRMYGSNVGDLAQSHLLVADATSPTAPIQVWHASITSHSVRVETLETYIGRTRSLFLGYAIYAIDLDSRPDFTLDPMSEAAPETPR
jgi:hypothetical protein